MEEAILEVKNLKTYFYNDGKELRASDDLSYQVHKGECVAIIGESGSGKTVEALSILRLIPYPPGLIVDGQILFHGQDLLQMSDQEMRQIRGSKISMIFQEASTALDPVMTIGNQIAEALRIHKGMKKKEALEKAVELLRRLAAVWETKWEPRLAAPPLARKSGRLRLPYCSTFQRQIPVLHRHLSAGQGGPPVVGCR